MSGSRAEGTAASSWRDLEGPGKQTRLGAGEALGHRWVSSSGVVTSKAVDGRTADGRSLTRVTVNHSATPRQILLFEGDLARLASGFRPGDSVSVLNGLDNLAPDRAWDIYVQQCFVPLGGKSHGQGIMREGRLPGSLPTSSEVQGAFGAEAREQDLAHAAAVYLKDKGISPRSMTDLRFSGSFSVPRGTAQKDLDAVYHRDGELWASKYLPSDHRLVFTETPVDALAYHQANRDEHACYVSVGHELSLAKQANLVRGFARLPQEVSLVAAFSGTSRGDRLARDLAELAPDRVTVRKSPGIGRTWTDLAVGHSESRVRSNVMAAVMSPGLSLSRPNPNDVRRIR